MFIRHIQPMFIDWDDKGIIDFERTLTPYWNVDASEVTAAKLKDKEEYDSQLRRAFEVPVAECVNENADGQSC